MLRRFSVNFALFSMVLDGVSVILCLWFSAAIRPALATFSFVRPMGDLIVVPAPLYILFPAVWVVIFSALSIYDGRKFLRAADELAALFLSTFIASISTAGILYFSYREVSRALFIVFVISTFLLCLLWRALARVYFRTQHQSSSTARRLLVIGMGPLGQAVKKHIQDSLS
jgi:FlaA1/EpsC-like NDP-sugar epimerase